MSIEITESRLQVDLSGILDRVAHGEEVTVIRADGPSVRLSPVAGARADSGQVDHAQIVQRIQALREKNGPLGYNVADLRHEGHRY